MTHEHELGTPKEVADYLRMSLAGLEQMRRYGTGPRFTKVGRRVLYRWTDIENYLKGRER